MNRLKTQPVGLVDGQQLARVGEIYLDAFPDHLRVPFSELAQTSERDQLHVALEGEEPVGFAAVKKLDLVGWTYLRYFAVDARRRRERLGLRLWQSLGEAVTTDGWPGRICLECEDPADAGDDDAERRVRENRVRFWTRCGTVPLPVPGYVMPPVTVAAAPEPVLLMAAAPAARQAQGGDLAALVRALYAERYGLSSTDSLVRKAIESITR